MEWRETRHKQADTKPTQAPEQEAWRIRPEFDVTRETRCEDETQMSKPRVKGLPGTERIREGTSSVVKGDYIKVGREIK